MLLQVARDYPGVPDLRSLTMREIRVFYDALRDELCAGTAPKTKPPKK
jgi:hypothetical protein